MIASPDTSSSSFADAAVRTLAGAAVGVGMTVLVLLSLAPPPEEVRETAEPLVEELHNVPLPPAPPPAGARAGAREQSPPPEIEVDQSAAPSPHAIRIVAAPPAPTNRPAATIQVSFAPSAFKPSGQIGETDARYIFKQSEVDQRVVVLHQKAPSIPMWLFRKVGDPRVTVLMVVNTDGTAENLHLLKSAHPEFDRLVLEAVAQWKFRPARKNGKNVRQWLQLPVYVKAPNVDHFSVQ